MTIARPQRPRGAGIGESPVSAARAAIEAARTSIIQAQTRVEAAQATERRILADIDDSELKAPAMAAFSIASLSGEVGRRWPGTEHGRSRRCLYDLFLPTEQAGQLALGSEARLVLMPRRIW